MMENQRKESLKVESEKFKKLYFVQFLRRGTFNVITNLLPTVNSKDKSTWWVQRIKTELCFYTISQAHS